MTETTPPTVITSLPEIGMPPTSGALPGVDALHATVRPEGIPVATAATVDEGFQEAFAGGSGAPPVVVTTST